MEWHERHCRARLTMLKSVGAGGSEVNGVALTRCSRASDRFVKARGEHRGSYADTRTVQLILLGIGCILGAVSMSCRKCRRQLCRPGVVLSFVIAGIACGLTGYAMPSWLQPYRSLDPPTIIAMQPRRDICLVARWILLLDYGWLRRCWQSILGLLSSLRLTLASTFQQCFRLLICR